MNDGFLIWVVEVGLRALMLLVPAGVALLALGRQAAAQRHAVWTAVAGAMLLLPVLIPILPPLETPLLGAIQEPQPQVVPPLRFEDYTPPHRQAEELLMVPMDAGVHPLSRAATVYFLICGAFLFSVALALIVVYRLRRQVRPLTDWRALLTAIDVADRSGLIDIPEIGASRTVPVPVTFGFFSPVIVLPGDWIEWDESRLRAVLAHEMAHVARADSWVHLLVAINRIVFWFHPLAWLAERRVRTLAEECCDEAAVRATGDQYGYAKNLLAVAAAAGGYWSPAAAIPMARNANLEGRIMRILSRKHPGNGRLRRSSWVRAAVLATPLLLVTASMQRAQQPAAAPEQSAKWDDAELLRTGTVTTAAQAAELEQRLVTSRDDVDARTRLLAFYFVQAQTEPWRKHMIALIDRHPEAPVLRSRLATYSQPFATPEFVEQAQRLWDREVAAARSNASVLHNAALAFEYTNLDKALDLLLQAAAMQPDTAAPRMRFAQMVIRPLFTDESGSVAGRLRQRLASTNDATLLLYLARIDTRPTNPHIQSLREWAVERARSINPAHPMLASVAAQLASRAPDSSNVLPNERVAPATLAVVERVDPVYPPLAAQARISGVCRFKVRVASDGTVENIRLISGHPLLVAAAQTALKQWRFVAPDEPVEFTIDIRLPGGDMPPGQRQVPEPVYREEPVYPALALQAGVEGPVQAEIEIEPGGNVKVTRIVSGHPLLAPAAAEAIGKWRFAPVAQKTHATVEVVFRKP